jgi:2-C-methyl-D-erythritol 4-phosphate cytidylyltransferase
VSIGVILAAAGESRRFGQGPKLSAHLRGKPVFSWSLDTFASQPGISQVIIPVHADLESHYKQMLTFHTYPFQLMVGSTTRAKTVYNAFLKLKPCDIVLIHDAARPFISPHLFKAVVEELETADAVIPVLPVTDTIKHVEENTVIKTLDRSVMAAVQTPQAFRYTALLKAYASVLNWEEATDEAQICEKAGCDVRVIPGDRRSLKLTYPDDLKILDALLPHDS